ncbi:hypothetical protein [Polaribacter sp. R77954]|uniref:hypothetical protein n=1 Tax=Polaribacter sp. R77954 TaxID=3093870 RepID=UPI0037C77DAE
MKFIYKTTLLFLLIPFLSSANVVDKKEEKSKKITKAYNVSSDAKIAISNKYGDLNIVTWNKNKVEFEITITVKGNNINDIEERLESIDVEFENSANYVSAKTILEKDQNSWSFWKKNNNLSYKINYKVKIPNTNTVDLNNDYGSIYLGNLSGIANINCDYGKIIVGNLTANNNTINLDYCSSSTIDFIKSGDINVDYSKITIEESENLKVNQDYSTIKIGKAENISFNADYGAISIDDAININGNSDYASIRLGTIYKNLDIETDYGSISVKRLAKDFENVLIDGQYAGIKIGVDEDAVFNFILDLQYAGFRYDDNKVEFSKKISKNNKKNYEGKFGRGNTNSKIKIKSQYGGVSIKENY